MKVNNGFSIRLLCKHACFKILCDITITPNGHQRRFIVSVVYPQYCCDACSPSGVQCALQMAVQRHCFIQAVQSTHLYTHINVLAIKVCVIYVQSFKL